MSDSNVRVVWHTVDMEDRVAYMARVSNPANQQGNEGYVQLIKYLINHKHWSPFEMVNVCFEIECTRDIARQLLRHRSFTFQEFSQRYAEPYDFEYFDPRFQDPTNRQSSLPCEDKELIKIWHEKQNAVIQYSRTVYEWGKNMGIAKELRRKVLPEGLTVSKLYVNGTLRSWVHYVELRCGVETQQEHREIALQVRDKLVQLCPNVMAALEIKE
jgi:thymidylate synthase (FAD)